MRLTLVACTPAVVLMNLALKDCALAVTLVKMFLISCAPTMPRLLALVTLAVVPTVLFLTAAPAPLNLHLRLTRTYLLECPFALAVSLRTVAKLRFSSWIQATLIGVRNAFRVGVRSRPLAPMTATFSLRFAALNATLFTWTQGPSLKPKLFLVPKALTLALETKSLPTPPREGTAGANADYADAEDFQACVRRHHCRCNLSRSLLTALVCCRFWLPIALVFCRSGLAAAFLLADERCSCM